MAFPKARALTDMLAAPVVAAAVTEEDRRELAGELRARLHGLLPAGAAGGRLTVSGYLLRSPSAERSTPFRWSPRTARRTIGLAAARRCLGPGRLAPATAVAVVIGELAAEGRRGLGRSGSVAGWLAGLPGGGRAAVQVEATGWCTTLLEAVEWDRLAGADVGPPDRWWAVGGVSLRGRADVRLGLAGPGGGGAGGRGLLTVVAGWPGPGSRVELGLAALVAAVGGGEVPGRVVGWWPECGRAVAVAVDRGLLQATAAVVVATVREVRQAG
ncbi:MAG TPA: hypothetical protein VHB02_16870 [Acidimicrobiales bacterium]|nr:hypothetical protein [Acidimicrobiales bacterium]